MGGGDLGEGEGVSGGVCVCVVVDGLGGGARGSVRTGGGGESLNSLAVDAIDVVLAVSCLYCISLCVDVLMC